MYQDIAAGVLAFAAVGALIVSIINMRKITTLSVSVDGRLTQLLKLTHTSAKAEGVKQEVEREK